MTSTRSVGALLRVPLAWKVAGANLVIALAAIAAEVAGHRLAGDASWTPLITVATIGAALAINFVLVGIALRPIRDLELTVERVSRGELGVRVPSSRVADRDVGRVGAMVNILLDTLSEDRLRMRQLTSRVIGDGERQRAAISHELHDSAAQTLSALLMHLSSAVRDEPVPERSARLVALRDMVESVIEEIRQLAHDVYPRVLEDLGLAAAVRDLAHELSASAGVTIDVLAPWDTPAIPKTLAVPVYQVVREAVANALCHADPDRIVIRLSAVAGQLTVTIVDNGIGFDVARVERTDGAMGLFAMRERAAIANASVAIHSRPGHGTTVTIEAPMITEPRLAELAS